VKIKKMSLSLWQPFYKYHSFDYLEISSFLQGEFKSKRDYVKKQEWYIFERSYENKFCKRTHFLLFLLNTLAS
jgi:hypothetical protein